MIFECPYRNGLAQVAIEYAEEFKKDSESMIEKFVKFDSVINCMDAFYFVLSSAKLIPDLETLPEEQKLSYWEQAKGLKIDKARKIKICRALYCFEKIME